MITKINNPKEPFIVTHKWKVKGAVNTELWGSGGFSRNKSEGEDIPRELHADRISERPLCKYDKANSYEIIPVNTLEVNDGLITPLIVISQHSRDYVAY